MARIGKAGQAMMMQASIFGMLHQMMHKTFTPQKPLLSSSNTPYPVSTGSFKQNQRRERKISSQRRHRRLSK